MFNKRKKTQARVITGLLTAVGAVGAFFGVRALMNWMNRRELEQEYSLGYDTGMEDDSAGSMFPANLGSQPETMPASGVTATGRGELGENYQGQFADRSAGERSGMPTGVPQDDRETIPATGMASAPFVERSEERARTEDQPLSQERARSYGSESASGSGRENAGAEVETDQPVPVGSLVGPLIVHLLSLHNMINLLKQRRETQASAGANVNTPDVREGGADAVSSLEAQIPEFDHAALVQGSLQARMVEVMERVRDTLQNTDYSEDQLFKISDELSPAVCKVLDLIHRAGQDDVTGFEDVQKAYQCR